jgi:hypothetical protein
VTATPPRADLRTLAAEAVAAQSFVKDEFQAIADAVLAAVLPEHRRMVLTDAADAAQQLSDSICAESIESNAEASRKLGMPATSERGGALEYAAGRILNLTDAIRRLAAAAPPAGLSAPVPAENAPAVPEEADGPPAGEGNPLDRFRRCPIGCGWASPTTEFDDEIGLRAARGQHLDRHSTYEVVVALDTLTVERDIAVRERDSLARRCALRYEETEKLRAEVEAHEGELGDMRASLSAAEADRDRLAAQVAHYQRVVEAAKAWRNTSLPAWQVADLDERALIRAVDALSDAGTDQTEGGHG